MMRDLRRNNHGMSLINGLLLILVVFLLYEILYVDLFGIIKRGDNPIHGISDIDQNYVKTYNSTDGNIQSNETNQITNENIQVIEPIIGNQNYQPSENIDITNHYYYHQLDEPGKIIYKALEDNIENMKTGTYKIDFKTQFNQLLKTDNGEEKLNISFQSAWNAFSYDYPGVFYIDVTKLILTTQTTTIAGFSTHRVSLSNDSNEDYFAEGITSEVDLRSKEKYVQIARNRIVQSLQGYSQYEQLKYLHDWIIDNFEYDTTYKRKDIHNVYGAFANQKVVCEGYARTLKYVLDGLGIENVLVSGTATNSSGETESHAWNYVKIDEKWYAVDVTWDDPVIKGNGKLTNKLRYQYFLRGSDEFFKNHIEDGYLSKNSLKFSFPTIEKNNYEK